MKFLLITLWLCLAPGLLAPTVVASNSRDKAAPAAGVEKPEPVPKLSDFMKALFEGKLTKPGRIIESVGTPKR